MQVSFAHGDGMLCHNSGLPQTVTHFTAACSSTRSNLTDRFDMPFRAPTLRQTLYGACRSTPDRRGFRAAGFAQQASRSRLHAAGFTQQASRSKLRAASSVWQASRSRLHAALSTNRLLPFPFALSLSKGSFTHSDQFMRRNLATTDSPGFQAPCKPSPEEHSKKLTEDGYRATKD